MKRSLTETFPSLRSNVTALGRPVQWARRRIGRSIIRIANTKRNAAYWKQAGNLYRFALLIVPERHDVAVQAGNCFKEAGCYDLALEHYNKATGQAQQAEALLQKGDALIRGGAAAEAIVAMEAALRLGHPGAGARLAEVSQFGLTGAAEVADASILLNQPFSERFLLNRLTRGGKKDRRWLRTLDRTSHESAGDLGLFWRDHMAFLQVGWLRVRHGDRNEPLLAGIVAIRARIVSSYDIRTVHLSLAGREISSGHAAEVRSHDNGRRLYSINLWVDASALPPGRKTITLTSIDVDGEKSTIKTIVNVVHISEGFDLKDSDSFVPSASHPILGDAGRLVGERPAQVRSASRRLFDTPVNKILAMRVDQLGDLSASLPALYHLRELFPLAQITALVAPSLVEVVQATECCDEVIGIHLNYDDVNGKRYLTESDEGDLRIRLSGRCFDLAVDLCPGDETRVILKMINAKFLAGFNPREFDFLDFGIEVVSRDKVNRIAKISHSASVKMLIDCLAEAQRDERPATPRLRDDSDHLSSLSLRAKNYLLVHTGARHPINRWGDEKYISLVNKFLRETEADVVYFSDSPLNINQIEVLDRPDRVRFFQKASMDLFDALITNAGLVIGNDSGPKHLAATRGVNTVSLHVNRLNWNEWGQDSRGLIVTKKVPCCGCGINDIKMCGKEAICLTSISVDEAFQAVMSIWQKSVPSAGRIELQ